MTSITTRAGKGSPLTHNEVDANFTNLNNDKLDTAGIALGSAASPTLKFTGDPNTGIYSPGADQLAVATNGTGRLFIDASGNVGVGAAAAANINLDVSSAGTTIVRSYAGAGNQAYLSAVGNAGTVGTSSLDIIQDATSIAYLYQRANQPLLIGTNNTEHLRITSGGRLLVGTSSDSGGALLQINDNRIRVATAKTPSFAADTGTAGEICWDADYIYVCTATNTWKRSAISTW
jgi:hypothetical protein